MKGHQVTLIASKDKPIRGIEADKSNTRSIMAISL